MRVGAIAWLGLGIGVLACVACGSGGTNAGPICGSQTFALTGSLDGASAKGGYAGPNGYAFANALGSANPGTLNVTFGDAGALHLEWTTLAEDDQTVSASGTFTMPGEGPHADQAYCVASGSVTPRSVSEGNGVSFTLTSVAAGACPGTPVPGSLQGCASP